MSADSVHRFIVAYDVGLDAGRSRVAKTLESYGDRIQYSVFIIDAKPAKVVRLRAAIRSHIDVHSDSVLICDLGPLGHDGLRRISYIGRERTVTGQGPLIF